MGNTTKLDIFDRRSAHFSLLRGDCKAGSMPFNHSLPDFFYPWEERSKLCTPYAMVNRRSLPSTKETKRTLHPCPIEIICRLTLRRMPITQQGTNVKKIVVSRCSYFGNKVEPPNPQFYGKRFR
jgi:hypothetical protein